MKKEANSRKLHIVLVVVTLAFLAFYVLKLCGYFDFTSRYGITHITSTVSDGEGALMIDGDSLTCWNTYDRKIKPESEIVIYFSDEKEVSGVHLDQRGENSKILEFFTYSDGEWVKEDCEMDEAGDCIFPEAVRTDRIRIAIDSSLTEEDLEGVSWQIKELEIYE